MDERAEPRAARPIRPRRGSAMIVDRPRRLGEIAARRSRASPPPRPTRSRSARARAGAAPRAIDRRARLAPRLVVGEPIVDGEHVAVLDDQIVAPQAERRGGAEVQRARIPPGDGVGARCRCRVLGAGCSRSAASAKVPGATVFGDAGSPSGRFSTVSFDLKSGHAGARAAAGGARPRADRSPASADRASRRRTGRRRSAGTTSRSRARVAAT